jgi:hypothetical protein
LSSDRFRHSITPPPGGHAKRSIELFDELGLRGDDSTAIDAERLLATGASVHEMVSTAVSDVALADPQEVPIGGTWGPELDDGIRAAASGRRGPSQCGPPSCPGSRFRPECGPKARTHGA